MAPRLDVVYDDDLPESDPWAPRDDCRGSLHYMVFGMASAPGLGTSVPVIAVVCRGALERECSSPCAFGMYSVGIKRAHEIAEVNKPRILSLDDVRPL